MSVIFIPTNFDFAWMDRLSELGFHISVISESVPETIIFCCWFPPLLREVFSPGTPVFPSPQKPTFPNSNSTRNQVDEEPLCGCATSKSLCIYLLFILIYGYFRGGH